METKQNFRYLKIMEEKKREGSQAKPSQAALSAVIVRHTKHV
jgi:hypothetical protein